MRKIVILNNTNNIQNIEILIKSLIQYNCASEIYVASHTLLPNLETDLCDKCTINIINVPDDKRTEPQLRNYVNTYFKSINFNGILHVITNGIVILKDPTQFITEIENMMIKLDYSVWFNTYTDKCNFVYTKYVPRLSMILDKPELSQLNIGKKLLFTSNANVNWVIYDFNKLSDDLLYFDEDFSIPMYFIIEYLARRRNTKMNDSLYFMNQYLTIESEIQTFICMDDNKQYSNDVREHDDTKFRQKHINYSPDVNLDIVLETTYKKLYNNI